MLPMLRAAAFLPIEVYRAHSLAVALPHGLEGLLASPLCLEMTRMTIHPSPSPSRNNRKRKQAFALRLLARAATLTVRTRHVEARGGMVSAGALAYGLLQRTPQGT